MIAIWNFITGFFWFYFVMGTIVSLIFWVRVWFSSDIRERLRENNLRRLIDNHDPAMTGLVEFAITPIGLMIIIFLSWPIGLYKIVFR